MTKNLRILITALMVVGFIATGVQLARPGTTAQIATDQKMYSVGQTMNILGTGFTPGANIYITVQNPDHSTGSVSPYPVTDSTGAFKAAYTPPLIPGRYIITATDGTNTAVTAVTEADAIGYNKAVYNKTLTAPEDTTGNWTSGNAGKAYLENQWSFYQYQITGVGSTIPDFDVYFNHYQSATNAVFIDALADFRACVDCTDSTFTTGNSQGLLLDTHPLPPSDTTNWVVIDTALSHINRPLNSAADGTGSTVLSGSSGYCSSDNKEPIPNGTTTFPAEFHCFHVTGASLRSLLGGNSVFNTGTHTVTLFFAAHLAASFVWGDGTAGVGGHEGELGDCSSPYYAKGLTGPLASFEPLWPANSGACTGIPKIYGTDAYAGWTTNLFGVGFASGSSRHFSLANQSAGPNGAIELPIPTVAAPTNTIVIVKQTVPSSATATFNFTSPQLGVFSLSNPFPSSKTFTGIAAGVEYDVSESALPGWTLTNLNCAVTSGTDDGFGTWPTNSTSSTAAITLGPTDANVTLTCTYTNTGTGHIIVKKHTNPAASPQSFAYTTTGTGYTGFSLIDGGTNTDGGTPPANGLTPGAYSVTESAVAGWTFTNRTCALTVTGSGTSTFPASGTTQPANITLGAGDTVTCDYYNSQPAGSITVAPSGVNEVNQQHIFTITATQVPNGATAATTANITYNFTPSNPGTLSSTCGAAVPFSGNTATCTVTVNNASAGLFTINATAVFTVGGVQITKTTDGLGDDSGPATKRWVDARISLTPQDATNEINSPHTITATVQQNDGLTAGAPGGDGATGLGPAPNGTLVTFSLLNNVAGATFVGGVNTCTTTSGTCTVQINSSTAGGVDIHATTTFLVGGVSLTRASGDGISGDSPNAHKTYISAGTTLTFNAALSSPLTVEAGQTVTIVVTETNVGSGPLTNVNVTGGGKCVSFTGGSSTLAAGASTNFTCTFTAAAGANAWSADGHGTDELNNAVPSTGEHAEGSVRGVSPATTLVFNAGLSSPANLEAGQTATIVVTETNTGNGPLHNVNVTGGGSCLSFSGGSSTLAAGASTNFTCTFTVQPGANAWSADGNGLDELNNPVPATGEHASGSVNGVSASTLLTFVSQVPSGTVEAGTSVTITVNEANTGNSDLTGVSVTGSPCATWTGPTTLASGANANFTCTFNAVLGTNSWSADGHGTDSLGNPVPATGEHQQGNFQGVLSTLILVKNTVGGDGTFSFSTTGTGLPVAPFNVTTSGYTQTVTWANIASGPKTITETVPPGWEGNTTQVACEVINAGQGGGSLGPFTSGLVDPAGTVSASVNLAVGATVQCTFTNSLLPTLNIIKYATSLGGPFNFIVTGPSPETPSLTVSSGNSAETGVHSIQIGDYTFAEDQLTLPAGFTMTDLSCTKGTGSLPNGNNIPTLWSFNATYGDAIVCEATNSNVQTTRTQGFWATHTSLSNNVWNGTAGLPGETLLGADAYLCTAEPITAISAYPPNPGANELMGGFWSNIAKKSDNKKRTPLDQARMQMLQQYFAAVLNVHAFGSTPSGISLAQARADYCSGDLSAIKADIGLLGTFNSSGDAQPFTPGASATAQESKHEADIPFWDNTYE